MPARNPYLIGLLFTHNNLVPRALFPGFGGGAGKGPGIGRPIRHFDWLIDLGNSCKKRAKMKIIYALCRNRNSKVYKTCGIKISEDDTRSPVLCRSDVTLVYKLMMDQFIRTAQSVDNKPSDLNSEYSVK